MAIVLDQDIQRQLDELIIKLKYKKIQGAFKCAEETLLFFRMLCNRVKWTRTKDLVGLVKATGKCLVNASPSEICIGNIIRRILHVIREESSAEIDGAEAHLVECPALASSTSSITPSATLPTANSSANSSIAATPANAPAKPHADAGSTRHAISLSKSLIHYAEKQHHRPALDLDEPSAAATEAKAQLRAAIVEGINDLLNEFELSRDNILQFAQDTIHSNEIILTIAHSHTVEKFLIEASAKRKFQVIVIEGGAKLEGSHRFAKKLAESGIQTSLLTYAACFAVMSKVNKVIIGAHAVLADGGVLASAGCHALGLCAKHYQVPVFVCAAIYRLSPIYPCSYDQDEFQNLLSPHTTLSYNACEALPHATVLTPSYDYLDSSLISIFISNGGGNPPSYIYRLISEYYHPDDYQL